MKHSQKIIRTGIALFLSFGVVLYLSPFFFINNTPLINTVFVASLPAKTISLLSSIGPASSPTPIPTTYPTPTTITATIAPTSTPIYVPPIVPTIKRTTPTTVPTRFPTSTPAVIVKPCPSSSNNNYSSLSSISSATVHPEAQADLNIALRGYSQVNEKLTLVDVEGDNDAGKAPQLSTVFGIKRAPHFTATYRINNWDWNTNSRGAPIRSPSVTLVAIAAKQDEKLYLPQSGYSIGGGKQALVLYATKNSITLEYTRDDSVAAGYSIHFDSICVDPHLLNLYNTLTAAGRSHLPALAGGEQIGTVQKNYIITAIRDSGTFMDPRIRKDWWIGY